MLIDSCNRITYLALSELHGNLEILYIKFDSATASGSVKSGYIQFNKVINPSLMLRSACISFLITDSFSPELFTTSIVNSISSGIIDNLNNSTIQYVVSNLFELIVLSLINEPVPNLSSVKTLSKSKSGINLPLASA